jgi:hypothetical protein
MTMKLTKFNCAACGKENEKYITPSDKLRYEGRLFYCNRECAKKKLGRIGKLYSSKYNNKCLFCSKAVGRVNTYYCNRTCRADHQNQQVIESWEKGVHDGLNGNTTDIHPTVRKYIWEKYDSKCGRCGWNIINPFTHKPPLQIEHIDGNWANNKEENLILLCPNCHALTETYANPKKGNGRWTHEKSNPIKKPKAIINEIIAIQIKQQISMGLKSQFIADSFSISKTIVDGIRQGRRWKDV